MPPSVHTAQLSLMRKAMAMGWSSKIWRMGGEGWSSGKRMSLSVEERLRGLRLRAVVLVVALAREVEMGCRSRFARMASGDEDSETARGAGRRSGFLGRCSVK
ncbi:hypothetical protein L1887_61761 [Cichorium endivia]|nr:hypothetical protein L1887_61761 [Cichorium endivia]